MDECGVEIQKRKECETMEISDLPTIHEIQDETEFVCRLKCIVEVHHKRAVHLKTKTRKSEKRNSFTVFTVASPSEERCDLVFPASRFHCLCSRAESREQGYVKPT